MNVNPKKLQLFLTVILLVILLVSLRIAIGDFSIAAIYGRIRSLSLNQSALIILLLTIFLIRPFTGFPPGIISFYVGLEFGLVLGLPLVVIGSTITAFPAYYFGRRSRALPDWVPGASRVINKSESIIDSVGVTRGMLAASLAPTPLDPVAYAAGLADVRPFVFFGATLIAAVPWAGAYCYLGSVAHTTTNPEGPPLILLIFGVLIAGLLLAPSVIGYLRSD